MYISSQYNLLQFSPLGIWQGLTGLIGLGCGTYVVFFYQRTQFKFTGKVSRVTRLTPGILEWQIALDRPLLYSKGQFIFVKVFKPGIEEAPHPFSISGGDRSTIYLTTRVLGDFTKLIYETLEVGTPVSLNGPYGRMDFGAGKQDQIWIAGGIGITPFIAYLRDNTFTQNVEMFYSFTGPAGAAYKEYLEQYAYDHSNFIVHIIDSTQSKKLNLADYLLDADNASIYMCGPQSMVTAFVKYFEINFRNPQITFEAFKLH
jgi:predicted ferric reductase